MRHHRILILLFAAALVSATVLAFTSAARAEDAIKAVNGTPIQQWTCNQISNENWSFGLANNILSSGISNTFSHCVATPGSQDGLAMELRFCINTPAQQWSRSAG